jgi:hypothetical protein
MAQKKKKTYCGEREIKSNSQQFYMKGRPLEGREHQNS